MERQKQANMLKFRHIVLIALLVNTSVVYAEVFKWVDAKGRVHYSDRPQQTDSEPVAIQPTSTSVPLQDTRQQLERHQYRERLLKTLQEERQRKQQAQQEAKQQRLEAQRRCQIAQDELNRLRSAPRLYSYDATGQRVIYDEQQRKQAITAAQTQVNTACQSVS